MTKRYEIFDWIRVGALSFILICHFLRCYPCCKLDLPLGAIGNTVFFVISGWLLGLAWIAKGRPKYGLDFVQKRLKRLAIPLWLALVLVISYQILTGHSVHVKNILMAATLTIWFDTSRIPGTTPYWFVTAIAIFYICLALWSRVVYKHAKIGGGVISAMLCGQTILSFLHVRYGWFICLILYGGILFSNADRILSFCECIFVRKFAIPALFCFMISFLGYYSLFYFEYLNVGTPSCYWLALVPSSFFIVVMFMVFRKKKNTIVSHVGNISYEIFLVHSFVLYVTCPLREQIALRAIVFLTGCYIGGLLLNRATNRILVLIKRKDSK